MSNETTTKPSREDFVKWIDETLTRAGFKKDSEKEFWINERDVSGPTQTIVINGQRMNRPGESRHMKFEVEVFGDGEMKDVDTEVVNSFIEVNFDIFQDGMSIADLPTFCMFFDDQMLFNNLINKIFRL